ASLPHLARQEPRRPSMCRHPPRASPPPRSSRRRRASVENPDPGFRLLPEQASTMAPQVDALFWFISGVAIFFTLLIAILLLTFATRYRRKTEDYYPTPVVGSTPLELVWTGIPLVLAMVMFGWGVKVYYDIVRTPDNALEVFVIGKQWMWHLQ